MWNKRKLNGVPLNSLFLSCIKECCQEFGGPVGGGGQQQQQQAQQQSGLTSPRSPSSEKECSPIWSLTSPSSSPLPSPSSSSSSSITFSFPLTSCPPLLGPLPLYIRQEILDYVIREHVKVSPAFIVQLLGNGGVHKLDLWSLSEINNYNCDQVSSILEAVIANHDNLKELSIGGQWIYNQRIINGPLRRLFGCSLTKLATLRLQETSSLDEFLMILENCPNLVQLEVRQPSLNDREIILMEKFIQIRSEQDHWPVFTSLKQLEVPSSLRRLGLIKLIAAFPNLQYLKCARFEPLLDAVSELESRRERPVVVNSGRAFTRLASFDSSIMEDAQIIKIESILTNLRGLSITHPLGCDTVSFIVDRCPHLEELTLEVQEGMKLGPIKKLQQLTKLKLRNASPMSTFFNNQVLPVLDAVGSRLNSLSIEHFDVVDLKQVALACPNLKSFSAQWFTIIGCNLSSNEYLTKKEKENLRSKFSSLVQLRLRPRSQGIIAPDCLFFLLSRATHIEDIQIYSCHNLTDDDLDQLRRVNPLLHLKVFILRHGHSVTKDALNRLRSQSIKLQFLDYGRPALSKAELVPNEEEGLDQL